MFLPLDRKPDWHNPPLITLIILLVNVLFFYVWQANDVKYNREAMEYYIYSGLYETELKKYVEFRNLDAKLTVTQIEQHPVAVRKLMHEMLADGDFQNQLDADKIIRPGEPGYDGWRSKRSHYLYLHDRVVTNKYGITPSKPTILTYFTNMFLHASNSHLWFNMLFFVLTGYVVEMIIGRTLYLLGYLISGLAAAWLYVFLFPHSAIPGIGASGAISGIMGMYIMIFGLRKVNFFYSLFVYFDYVRAPAILMLPIFIFYQAVLQFVFDTNVNVSAHAGGFLGGLLFAGVLKFIPGAINLDYVDEKQREDNFQQDYQAAMQLLASMKIDEAREKFEDLHKRRPADTAIMQQLYNVAKYNPASEAYHRYAAQLLDLHGSDLATVKLIRDTFIDYAARAKPKPRWSPESLISMATRFASSGYLSEAEKLVHFLLKVAPEFQRIPEGLAALAKYYNGKDKHKMEQYRSLLVSRYPDSSEAIHLQKSLRPASD